MHVGVPAGNAQCPAGLDEAVALRRLFQRHSTTVSAWIRRQRLERARRDLVDPALRLTPVHQIAARWGFNDHSTFTRAFRAVYDLPPRDYRFHVLAPSGAAAE